MVKNITLSVSDELSDQMKAYPEVNWSGLARQSIINYLEQRARVVPPNPRTLDNEIPELKPYLHPGITVLDVGCGYGTITLGVANVIKPGKVVGVDIAKKYIDGAQEWATQVEHSGNITFQVGNSYRLDFPDHAFDLVYSHTALHFFIDPVLGLEEQKRVTKPDGWVIALGVRDYIIFRYPQCPNWDKVYDAYHRYMSASLEKYQASGLDLITFFDEQYQSDATGMFYADMYAGRQCLEWFDQAGFTDINLSVQPRRVKYQGQEGMKPDIFDMLVLLDEPISEQHGFLATLIQRMITVGFLDNETVERAKEEARAWYNHPGAFQFWPEIFVAGRVT